MVRQIVLGLAVLMGVAGATWWARAGTGETTGYSGYLERNGAAVDDDVSMSFHFHPSETSNTELGAPVTVDAVPVRGGRFNVSLPLSQAVLNASEVWLAITVDGVPLAGRQRWLPVSFSIRSNHSDTAAHATNASAVQGLLNFCIMVKPNETCPAPFNVTTGKTEFRHTHSGVPAHSHRIRVDGSGNGGSSTCTLDLNGSANVDCTGFAPFGQGRTESEGSSLAEAGQAAYTVCCNY